MEEEKATTGWSRNQNEKIEVDRTHPEENCFCYDKTEPEMAFWEKTSCLRTRRDVVKLDIGGHNLTGQGQMEGSSW